MYTCIWLIERILPSSKKNGGKKIKKMGDKKTYIFFHSFTNSTCTMHRMDMRLIVINVRGLNMIILPANASWKLYMMIISLSLFPLTKKKKIRGVAGGGGRTTAISTLTTIGLAVKHQGEALDLPN